MAENNETPQEEFAKAEIARDDSVKNLLDPAKTGIERDAALAVTRRRTALLNRAARRLQPPSRDK